MGSSIVHIYKPTILGIPTAQGAPILGPILGGQDLEPLGTWLWNRAGPSQRCDGETPGLINAIYHLQDFMTYRYDM